MKLTVDEVLAVLHDPEVHLAAESRTLTRMRERHAVSFIAPIQAVPGVDDFGHVTDGPTTPSGSSDR